SATITVPIRRLRDQAHAILDPRGRLLGGFVPSRARDEVGELSRSLGELIGRLQKHMRLVESFATDVSHELKNPLASIRAAAELALSSEDPAERHAMLTMVLQDVSRMERLLTGVGEISRIDSGAATERTTEAVSVRTVAEGVIDAARLRGRGAAPILRLTGKDASVWVPPGRLQQVLENLLENAVSFSPPGTTVTVSVEREQRDAVIRVSDEGSGIPEEHRERIFERFFSFRPDEEKGAHAGLGLAIVKSIAESYGGRVRIVPCTGPGACFEVRLPAA
ncbi:MAG TPA: HAMP domain-containing sensor histidine kinase, partial [Spirochaetia bacterium]